MVSPDLNRAKDSKYPFIIFTNLPLTNKAEKVLDDFNRKFKETKLLFISGATESDLMNLIKGKLFLKSGN